ncbi:M1 family metallopeptidase [Mangrovimonas sp. TPBH4]|uniref:M1 family metallopeptidase n=1 Tax=Mangrovimonas sp. TPBH4 TaxID=1645914 RepID=UPI0006B475BC|nr:M1 family metallopeptidase [Mangrovimonas sp. TPBH4]
MKYPSILLFAIALSCFNCASEKEHIETKTFVEEPHSFAVPNKAYINHLNLDIEVDFNSQTIKGSATYDITNNNASEIVLDSKFLNVKSVLADGEETTFHLGDFDEFLGQPLHIDIKSDTKTITVFYETTEQTEALQWLAPQQTADKTHPFLFTQGQAILTRTWIPIQDSPQIRITYNATVKVPTELMAVMSAENPQEKNPEGLYHFQMKQPISPYLIALSVGNLEYRAISNRTGVYAETSMIDKVQNEFSEMDNMLKAAEALYGTYAWEQFDVIVLPPSFPFGGMENPRLTFATPTLIAGDKSLTSVIAHELAHSWSGNLVTNSTWNDFWLNEGFTVYFEIRIMEALYGKERANMLALIGRQDLEDEMEDLKDTPESTQLKLDLKNENPDDGMNSIAYDKGYRFLRTLEETVGRDKFDVFLKSYFTTNAFTTLTTEDFVNYLNTQLLEPNNITFNTEEWIYKPGIPSNAAVITSDKFNTAERTLEQYLNKNEVDTALTNNWTTQEWVHFIRNFPKTITSQQMALLDNAFDFTNSGNSHIAMVWFEQSILHDYRGNDVDKNIASFLSHVGRRWYVETLFKAYKKADKVEEALSIYRETRGNYHSVTAGTIDTLLEYEHGETVSQIE